MAASKTTTGTTVPLQKSASTPGVAARAAARTTRRTPRRTPPADTSLPTPSLDEVIEAYQAPGRPDYDALRERYARTNGSIRDSYFARHIHAGILVVRPPARVLRWGQNRKLRMRYDSADAAAVQPDFEAAVWRARGLERTYVLLLRGRSRKVLVEQVFAILVYLMGVLDATVRTTGTPATGSAGTPTDSARERVAAALGQVDKELDRLQRFALASARKAALRAYLTGLPVGLLVCTGLVLVADLWSTRLVGAPSDVAKVCFTCGAVGGAISVMTRITRGQRVEIDEQQGATLAVVAGSFRPVIGAVFGLALFVFVKGGLLPLAVPSDASSSTLFFAALAFLGGFSERWAADTLTKSAPKTTPPTPGRSKAAAEQD